MILLIDIGNTRIKWAQLKDGGVGPQSAAAYAGWQRDDVIHSILQPNARPDRVLIANVGGMQIGNSVRDAIASEWGVQAEFMQSTAYAGGVRNAYADPAKLGVDRWLAVIGAHAMEQRAACVVSAGTAMTIDAVDAQGRHLGGVIVPGPALMVSSLLRNTSEIAHRAEQGSVSGELFANNTLGAVQQGVVHALAALIERSVRTTQERTGAVPILLLTGGASLQLESSVGIPFRTVPDLVLRGLAVLASQP